MKKTSITVLVLFIIIIIIVYVNFSSINTTIKTEMSQFITEHINESMSKNSTYGRIGRDTVDTLSNGKFQIVKINDSKVFCIYNENLTSESLLCEVLLHKKIKNHLYIISSEGYGVVDENSNICTLYITTPSEEFISGYSIDSNGVKHSISKFSNNKNVKYLESFYDFSKEEQSVLKKMEEKYRE